MKNLIILLLLGSLAMTFSSCQNEDNSIEYQPKVENSERVNREIAKNFQLVKPADIFEHDGVIQGRDVFGDNLADRWYVRSGKTGELFPAVFYRKAQTEEEIDAYLSKPDSSYVTRKAHLFGICREGSKEDLPLYQRSCHRDFEVMLLGQDEHIYLGNQLRFSREFTFNIYVHKD